MLRGTLFLLSILLSLPPALSMERAGKKTWGFSCDTYFSESLQKNIQYCTQRTHPEQPVQKGEAVVYFMHGISGSATSFRDNGYAEAVGILRKEEEFPPITFVSFDSHPTGYFSDVGGLHQGPDAYESWFITEFMPTMERKLHVCARRECRGLAGVSMGGFGALKTALRHSDKFFTAAANSPALMPFNVQENDWSWLSYFGRHPVGPVKGMQLLRRAREIFSSREWSDFNDPAWLAQNFWDVPRMPSLYFDCGGRDYFGFQEGYWRLKNVLDARGIAATTHFAPEGTHDLFWERRWWLIRFLRDQLSP